MSNKDIKILYIDDEEPNLIAFKAIFRRRFKVITATNGDEGLDLLRANTDIKVVISDQKMDHESGVEFFCRMIPLFPNPIRIILTGFTNHQAMSDAINLANVYRFITKPWNEIDLSKTIESAIELYDNRVDLRKKNAELKATYDEMSKFVYSVTHDMRTPILLMIEMIQSVKQDNENASINEILPTLEKNILALNSYVRNIVEFHQNKEKKSDIDLINLNALLDDILNSPEFSSELKSVTLTKNVHVQSPFHSDKYRLRVILSNLLSNGIKYQKKSNTNKKLVIEACDVRNGVEIKITDNGIGISSDSKKGIQRIFTNNSSNSSNTGIGLFIAHKAVQNIEGELSVESVPGAGTTFTLSLPNLKNLNG